MPLLKEGPMKVKFLSKLDSLNCFQVPNLQYLEEDQRNQQVQLAAKNKLRKWLKKVWVVIFFGLDSIAISIFKDILVELTNTEYQYQYQTPKSKKNLLIVRRGALSILDTTEGSRQKSG